MAQLFAPHYHTILDANGDPVSGGYVRFYTTGTTTLATVYSDAALESALGETINGSTGVAADSAGRLPAIYLDPNVVYRIREYDASDALIRETDPLTQNATTSLAHTPKSQSASLALSGFLDRFGTWAEDEAGVQQANDYIVGLGKRDLISLPPGVTIDLSTGVEIDASFVSFDGRGARFDASGMTTGSAVTITGSVDPPYDQSMNELRLPELVGPGNSSSVDGILLTSDAVAPAGYGPAHLSLFGLNVSGFRYGVIFRNRAYLTRIYDSDFSDCEYLVWQDSAEDGHENNALINCALFNAEWAVKMSAAAADLHLSGCSMDAMERLFQVDAGTLWLDDCHLEQVGGTTSYTDTPILLNGEFSRLYWRGGSRRVPVGATRNFDYWASLASGSLLVDEVDDALSDKSGTGIFATGAGTLLRPLRIGGNETRDNCWIAHETKSRVPDPDFAALANNCLYVFNHNTRYADTDTNSISVTGGELKATKATAATNVFQFALVLPAEPGELIGGAITYRKPGSQAGSMTIDAAWGWMDPVSSVVPNIPKQSAYASNSITVPSSAVTDTQVNFSPLSSHRAPSWANCWLLIFTLTDMAAGDVYFSAPNFERAG